MVNSGSADRWVERVIGDFTDCSAGGTPSTAIESYWGGEIKWMSSGELHLKFVNDVEGRITEKGLKNSSAKIFPPNCVLIGLAGQGKTRGTVAINNVKLCTNQSIAAIYPNDSFEPKYLYYNLDNRYKELRELSTGAGGRGGLNLRIIRNISVPFPNLDEQKKIARVLGDIDELLTALGRLITKKRNIKSAVMHQLLTGKKRLPGFTHSWEEKSLFSLSDYNKDLFNDGDWVESEHIVESGIRLIQTGNIGIGIFLDKESRKYISQISFDQLGCKEVISGDLLICRLAEPAGRACIMPDIGEKKMITSVDVTIFRPLSTHADPRYLVQLFSTRKWFDEIEQRSGGSTRSRIARGELGKIIVNLPPIEEQQAIASILSDIDAEISTLKARRVKTQAIKQGMMQELLTGRTRLL